MKEVEKQRITKVITQDLGISMHLKDGKLSETEWVYIVRIKDSAT